MPVSDAEFPELCATDFTGGTLVAYGLTPSGAVFEHRRYSIDKTVKTDGAINVDYGREHLEITAGFTFLELDGVFFLVRKHQQYEFLEYAIAPKGVKIPQRHGVSMPQ